MRLNKICALLALLIFPLSTLHAQQFTIRGYAIDAYTTEMIDSVWVTLMGTDSTIIATHFKERNWGHFDSTYLVKTDTAGTFIVKFARKGYFDKYVTKTFRFNPHRLTTAYMNDVPMIKLPKSSIKLGEATVKATKLMMVMRGDTLVYNADAFQLAEGSMLDKLIAMLPGVELKKDGVITVNGRRVERLLVNGEDFFTGSPKVALENLPAYTVDEVKVYERMNDRDRALGYTKEEVGTQPLAMDVQLKKQFSMGGFANVGGAYGTDGHYGARLFGLRFTRQSRIGMYANINDFMGGSFYDSNGNWQAHNGGSLATTKDLGFYYLIKDRRQRFKVDGSTRFWYLKTPTESKQSTTTFFDSGDVFSRTRQRSVAHELVADAAFNLQFTPPDKQLFMTARPQFNYRNYDRTDGSQSADWSCELTERYMGEALDSLFGPDAASHLRENLISSLETNSLAKGHSFRGGGTLQGSWRVPNSSDAVNFFAGGNYNYMADRTLRTSTATSQADPTPGDEARFTDHTARNYQFFAQGTYNFQWDFGDRMSFLARPHYGYNHSYQSARNPYYVLEGTAFDTWSLDQLASNRSALQDRINAQNSYYSTRREQYHTGGLLLGIRKQINSYRRWEINFTPAANYVYERLDYDRDRIDTLMRRRRAYFQPYVWLFFQPYNNSQLYLDYSYYRQAPDLLSLLDYEDTSDPLVRRFGNPGLRDTRTHTTSLSYHVLEDKEYKYNVSIEVRHRLWTDAVAQGMTYDTQTGMRTYRPENVNGNWELTSSIYMMHKFGRVQKMQYWLNADLRTNVNYRNNVDLISLDGMSSSVRSSVRTLAWTERVGLWGSYNQWGYGIYGKVTLNHSTGNYIDRMNVYDYSYGGNLDVPLPWKFSLSTTVDVYSRRGYSDSRFNTDDVIWSASLSRSILKGALNFRLEAFDILGQINRTAYTINAQMQTETWRNVLGRYAMLHVTYRLNFKPWTRTKR